MTSLIRPEDPTELSDNKLVEHFLDYFNNYLSVERFAEANGWFKEEAQRVIDIGRDIHEERVKPCKQS